jgi:hypothetical protein
VVLVVVEAEGVVVVVVETGEPVVVVVAAGCDVVVVDEDGVPPGGAGGNARLGPVGRVLAAGGKPHSGAKSLRVLPSIPSAQMPTPPKLRDFASWAAS